MLTSPPMAVCNQGLEATRKYFDDLKIDPSRNQRLIPVSVMGKSQAGKSSLVQSMEQNKRLLTVRNPADAKINAAPRMECL